MASTLRATAGRESKLADRPLRIALTDFHNNWGGQPMQVYLLGKALAARGHAVTVHVPPGSDLATRCAEAGLTVETGCRFRRGFRPWAWARDLAALRSAFRRHRIEVVHCHGSQDTWLAVVLRRLLRGRFVLLRTKHNSYPVARHLANRWLFQHGLDRFIAVAESIRAENLPLLDPERAHTIHAGLDDAFGREPPPNARASVRAEFGLDPTTPLVGLVGRLEDEKGQGVLMRALAGAADLPAVHALLIGTGGAYDRQRAMRDELCLSSRVHFTLFRNDVERLTAALDVALLPALDCDASSTILKEAMSLGVPVIASRVGGAAEILEEGRCGWLIPVDDPAALAEAIRRVLRERGTADQRRQIERARERVESEYRMAAVAERTERVYRAALEARWGP